MNDPLFVSFYTDEGDYEKFAKQLETSLKKFDLRYQIDEIKSQRNWNLNNAMKANFILKKVLTNRCKVIWLDCDCEIIERPALFFENWDFTIYRWTKADFKINPAVNPADIPDDVEMFSGGVMGFNYTAKSLEFLIRWVNAVNYDPKEREDITLDKIYKKYKNEIKLNCLWLPKSYNRMDKHWPTISPVINHYWEDGKIFSSQNQFKVP